MTTARIGHTMKVSGLQAPTLRTPGGTIQLEGETSTPNGKLIKGSIMSPDTMTTLENTENIGVILMNKIFGNTAIGRENGSENGRDLSLTGTGTMRGGPSSEVRVPCTCGVHRVPECLLHIQRDCQVTLRGGSTDGPRSEVAAAVQCRPHGTIRWRRRGWSATQRVRRQTKNGLLTRREWRGRDE